MRVYSLHTKIISVTSAMVVGFFFMASHASAATLTVNSKADSVADDGSCTLREAITATNSDTASGALSGECIAGSGTDTINFSITGTADFVNGGQNGYTIQPTSGLPSITDTLNIDGYTQPGAQANTAIAPNPLNGRLLVEIDGALVSASTFDISSGGSDSSFKGLVIGGFTGSGFGLNGCSNVSIMGNYIGTQPDGVTANRNGIDNVNSSVAISIGDWSQLPNTDFSTTGTKIGSINPADRNVISGNYGGAIGIIGANTTVLGNYLGVGSDGVTALGNAQGTGVTTGGMTIDYAQSVTVGGDAVGSANVISSNKNGGIHPDYSSDIDVIGNFLGTDYSGTLDRGNGYSGISFAQVDTSGTVGQYTSTVRNNIIKFNDSYGVFVNDYQMDDIEIINNTVSDSQTGIGVSSDGGTVTITNNTTTNNTGAGISIDDSDNQILDNVISNNHGPANMLVSGTSAPIQNLTIQGNKIGTKADGTIDGSYTQSAGILMVGNVSNSLIGGTDPGDGNIIAGNDSAGIANSGMNVTGFGVMAPTSNTILGNSIFGNDAGNIYGFPVPGLGIDNYMVNLDGSFVPQSTSETGVTANDATDADTGPNNYMNFPVLNSATQTDTSLTLSYDLDAADSPTNQYRVEFFANDTADTSGYGEGQTYLGSVTATNGTGNTANLTLPSGTNLTGKVLSATTTAIDSSTPSDFGSTSEFSAVLSNITVNLTQASTTTPDQLASTGENLWLWLTGALSLIGVGVYVARAAGRR